MFERLKALKRLNKMDKFLKGSLIIAELTNDREFETIINEAISDNYLMKKSVLKSRKKAKKYNRSYEKMFEK